ncbi:MAG TPA: ABC transporter permease, partial [Bacteroidota bacterium]
MVFLVLGLTIAVTTVVTLITVSDAMNADIANKLDEFGANIVIVPKSDDLSLSYGGMTISGVSVDVKKLREEDGRQIRTIKNSENIKIVAPKLVHTAKLLQRNVLVVGVEFPQELQLKKWWRIVGRKHANRNDAIIGAEVKEKLQLVLNQTFVMNGREFVAAGILEPTGSQDDGIVFIDLAQAQQLFGK